MGLGSKKRNVGECNFVIKFKFSSNLSIASSIVKKPLKGIFLSAKVSSFKLFAQQQQQQQQQSGLLKLALDFQ
jgi:hypothetical protein